MQCREVLRSVAVSRRTPPSRGLRLVGEDGANQLCEKGRQRLHIQYLQCQVIVYSPV